MKECTYCGHQNTDAATVCEECGTAFPIPQLTDPKLTDPAQSLVIVKTFDDVPAATLLKDRLEQAGIEACIPEELDPSPFGNFKPLARVTVRVARKDLEAAREILAAEG
jgi:Putative prokaryotic signal transducing protein